VNRETGCANSLSMLKHGVAMLLMALTWMSPAHAHEGGVDVRGVVQSIESERISVRAKDGSTQTFALTNHTQFETAQAAARREDVKVGMRVVVHGRKAGGLPEARLVRLGTAPAGAPAH